jgi:hypothetical protein
MIQFCPNCGFSLEIELNDGLGHCGHCNQIFDSSDYNKLLAASWQIRKERLSLEQIKWQLKLGDDFSIFAYTFVSEYGYSHDDFVKLLKKFGVANKSYIDYTKQK